MLRLNLTVVRFCLHPRFTSTAKHIFGAVGISLQRPVPLNKGNDEKLGAMEVCPVSAKRSTVK